MRKTFNVCFLGLVCFLPTVTAVGSPDANQAITQWADECAKISGKEERLACFDKITEMLRDLGVVPYEDTASTKDITANLSPTDYKTVDPEDIFIAPNKFRGKPIKLNAMRCFFADTNDYRCVAPSGSSVAIFASDVRPADMKVQLEDRCGAIKKIDSSSCRFAIRIVPSDFSEDFIDAMRKRMVVKTGIIELVTRKPSPSLLGRSVSGKHLIFCDQKERLAVYSRIYLARDEEASKTISDCFLMKEDVNISILSEEDGPEQLDKISKIRILPPGRPRIGYAMIVEW